MTKLLPSITIYGENFYPDKISNYEHYFSNIVIKNSVCKKGRYKGKLSPYGAADIVPTENIQKENDKLFWVINTYKSLHDEIRRNGGDDIKFDIAVNYENQCNFDFSVDFLKEIASLEIPLTISCYDILE